MLVIHAAAVGESVTNKNTPVTLDEWRALLAEIQSRAGMRCENHDEFQYMCDTANPPTIWIFTRPGHPAHPAATRGMMVVNSGVIDVNRVGYYAGDKDSYDRWMKEFRILDL